MFRNGESHFIRRRTATNNNERSRLESGVNEGTDCRRLSVPAASVDSSAHTPHLISVVFTEPLEQLRVKVVEERGLQHLGQVETDHEHGSVLQTQMIQGMITLTQSGYHSILVGTQCRDKP